MELEINKELKEQLQKENKELETNENPLQTISNIQKSNLLQVVLKNPEQLSLKKILLNRQPSKRVLNQGYGSFNVKTKSPTDHALFNEYILEHFSDMTEPNDKGKLSYELEYLLEGKGEDQKNLEGVVRNLLLMRVAPNYLYLQSDTTKQAEAEALALALSTAVALPILSSAVKQALLVAWAFGESIIDLRALLGGKKVSFIKNSQNWQLQLSSLQRLGTSEDREEGMDMEEGLSYKEYVRILLYLSNQDDVTMRALDLIEQNIQTINEKEFFRVDACISKLEIKSICKLKRGISYQFFTYFAYQ